MNKPKKFYDVYVSYPPSVDRNRINACLYDNLPENEAHDLIQALSEHPQAIIAENCTQDERENAQHYFNYLGLDVIVRQSLELVPHPVQDEAEKIIAPVQQCPVCSSISEDPLSEECDVCHLHFASATETQIQRKRIEWEEKIAFDHKKQAEIAHKLQVEKEKEEKRLRKQIRAELEEKLREEMGQGLNIFSTNNKNNTLIIILSIALILILITVGYFIAKF